MNRQHYLSKLLAAVLMLGAPLGIHAQEKPPKPVLKEHKTITTPINKYFELQRKPIPSGQESESAQSPPGLPPVKGAVPVDRIPPKRIGDLQCGQPKPGDNDWNACQDYCKTKPETPCVMLCTYRKNEEGICALYVQCTNLCNEIPEEIDRYPI